MKVFGQIVRIAIGTAIVAAAVFFLGRLVVGFVGDQPPLLSFNSGTDRGGCPGTPNCVSSYAVTPEHVIDPIACDAPDDTRIQVFAEAMDSLPDVERTGDTSWVVYSRIFRFPDDVRVQTSQRGIEIYSASRLGAGDLGVNRNRMERMRELVTADPRCG